MALKKSLKFAPMGDIPFPVVVTCPLAGPSTEQCQITETEDAIQVDVEIPVRSGRDRQVTVTVLDQLGRATFQGQRVVDVQQATEVVDIDLIRLMAENALPQAQAGPDQTVPPGTMVRLDGSGSSDVDGDALLFTWTLLSAPAGSLVVLSDATAVQPTFGVDLPGTYVLQLVVSDGQLQSPPASVTISTENVAPVANAGPAQSVSVGTTVRLDGSGSSDVDGDALLFTWTLLSAPAGSLVVLSDATAVQPTFGVDLPGTYVLQLVVSDGQLQSPPASVTISTENVAPVANAGPAQSVSVGTTVRLDGSRSSDVDRNQLIFAWAFSSTPAGSLAVLSDATAVQPTFRLDVPGTYVLQLVVSDGQLQSAPATVLITTVNSAPMADAGTDQTARVGATVRLDGSRSSDVDGDQLTFAWAFTSTPAGSAAVLLDAAATRPSFVIDLPGFYVLQLIVDDGTSASVPATVRISTTNSVPVANAGPAQTVSTGMAVQLDGRDSSDADLDPLTFAWALTTRPAGSNATLTGPTTGTPTLTPDVAGTYVVQLIVNDGTASSPPATVLITATAAIPANRPPVARAGADQTVTVGRSVTLDGTNSSDPEMTPVTFAWSFTARPDGSTATLANPMDARPTFVADVIGTYSLQLRVNDGLLNSPPDTVEVRAEPGIQAVPGALAVEAGGTGTLTVVLGQAPAVMTTLTVTTTDPAVATLPGAVTVAVGQTVILIPVLAEEELMVAGRPDSTTVTLTLGNTSLSTVIFVNPPLMDMLDLLAGVVGGVVAEPSGSVAGLVTSGLLPTLTLTSGDTRPAILPLTTPAPSGGLLATVTISDATVATVPNMVPINAGAQNITFPVTALATGEALLTVTAGAEVIQLSLFVDRAPALIAGFAATVSSLILPATEATITTPPVLGAVVPTDPIFAPPVGACVDPTACP